MVNYNIDILKKNILELMDKQNITQSKLSEETGIHQPFISKVLSRKDKSCFTIQQLIEIANFFHVSIDSLLGITAPEKQPGEKSLADVFEKLFEIDKIIGIEIGFLESDNIPDDVFSDKKHTSRECIHFKNEYITKVLKEWMELNSPESLGDEIKGKILQIWKDNVLEEGKLRLARWNFRNEEEEGEFLANEIIEEYKNYSYVIPRSYSNSEMSALKTFMNSLKFTNNFTYNEENIIKKCIE